MRSKANFKTHPIHPMLIPFPIAFLTGALIFNVLGLVYNNSSFWITGGYLTIAGIFTGIITAIPGIIDYIYTVPPQSSAKKRATVHMIVNSLTLLLFAIGFWVRGSVSDNPPFITLVLQAAGVGLMTFGGWLGGTLVYRNQIGVDHRYAGAGKWKEGSVPVKEGKKLALGKTNFLKLNQMKLIHLDGKRIVLARTENGYAAFDDHCTHKGASLADGSISCGTVQCPWHGSQFDVFTGKVTEGPAKEGIKNYPIKVEEENVYLILE